MFNELINKFKKQFDDLKARYAPVEPEPLPQKRTLQPGEAEYNVNTGTEIYRPNTQKVEIMEPPQAPESKVEVVEPSFSKPKVEVVPEVGKPDFQTAIAEPKKEYPQDQGDMSPVMVKRKVGEEEVEIDANNVESLKSAYLVRPKEQEQYGGPIRSIGNIDLETHPYATSQTHIDEIKRIYKIDTSPRVGKKVKDFDYFDMQKEFEGLPGNVESPLQHISGQISELLEYYGITPGEFVAVVRQDSGAGTRGPGDRAYDNKNPGNVENTDDGTNTPFPTWIEGCAAAIRNLAERKVIDNT